MSRFGERLHALGFSSYAEYLNSDHWHNFRKAYRESGRPRVCAVCGASPIQLHHHTYDRLGREPLDDVTPLCRPHHEAVHEWLKLAGKPVGATKRAVAALRGSAPAKVRTAAEGKAFGLKKRDEARARKKAMRAARRGTKAEIVAANKEFQKALYAEKKAFGPLRQELDRLRHFKAISRHELKAVVRSRNHDAAQKLIEVGRARLAGKTGGRPGQGKKSRKKSARLTEPPKPSGSGKKPHVKLGPVESIVQSVLRRTHVG